MPTKKKNSYVDEELEWLEARANEIKKYVDKNPYHLVKDRIESFNTPAGETDKLVQSIENQQKSIRESLKDYALLVEAISKLREKEEQKQIKIRGTDDLSPLESGEI